MEEEIYLTPSGKDEGLRIPEVQAAMKDAVPQLERTLKSGGVSPSRSSVHACVIVTIGVLVPSLLRWGDL